MNTRFQRIAKVIAEIFRAKIKNYFTKSSLYSTLKKKKKISDILLIKKKPNKLNSFFQLNNNLRFYKIFTFRQLSPDFHLAERQMP